MTANFPLGGGGRRVGGGILSRMATLDPQVNLGCQKPPQPSELVGGYFLAVDPFVDRVRVDAWMRRAFSY